MGRVIIQEVDIDILSSHLLSLVDRAVGVGRLLQFDEVLNSTMAGGAKNPYDFSSSVPRSCQDFGIAFGGAGGGRVCIAKDQFLVRE